MNGMSPLPRQIKKRSAWSVLGNRLLMLHIMLPPPVRLAFVLMLIVLVGSLLGCATTSTPSSEPARNPSIPPSTLSEHSQTFSSSAAANIQAWRKKLTELLPK